ncbi:hypothetical protein [Polaromonas sp. UC242_47]|uniref:hypothetical protein n=1 Tax=Polaromonas sp. UC242_47 TaxID=3374626 RepID=UPI0037A3B3CE
MPVAAQNFKYNKFPLGEFFSPPETKVGRKGQVNQVEFTSTETPDSTEDHGLDDPIPNSDSMNAAAMPACPTPNCAPRKV